MTTEFVYLNKRSLESSSWVDHPSQNKTGLYKFSSLELNLDTRVRVMNRETYDLLSWLGDLGGLLDALKYAGEFLLAPYLAFTTQSTLLRSLFRMKP